jgi:hypothetical protein
MHARDAIKICLDMAQLVCLGYVESMQGYAPTVAAVYDMQGSHYLMHAGQWVVVRRQLGKPPLY